MLALRLVGWEMVREKGNDTFSSNPGFQRRGKRGVADLALEDGIDVAVESRDGVAFSG